MISLTAGCVQVSRLSMWEANSSLDCRLISCKRRAAISSRGPGPMSGCGMSGQLTPLCAVKVPLMLAESCMRWMQPSGSKATRRLHAHPCSGALHALRPCPLSDNDLLSCSSPSLHFEAAHRCAVSELSGYRSMEAVTPTPPCTLNPSAAHLCADPCPSHGRGSSDPCVRGSAQRDLGLAQPSSSHQSPVSTQGLSLPVQQTEEDLPPGPP